MAKNTKNTKIVAPSVPTTPTAPSEGLAADVAGIKATIGGLAEVVSALAGLVERSNTEASSKPLPTAVKVEPKPKRVLTADGLAALSKNRAAYHGYIKAGGLPVPPRKRDGRRFVVDAAFTTARDAYRAYLKDGVIRLRADGKGPEGDGPKGAPKPEASVPAEAPKGATVTSLADRARALVGLK